MQGIRTFFRFFRWSLLATIIVLGSVAVFTRDLNLLGITFLLALLEVGLSFDNAVVNALVLKTMDEKWQKRFLLWGILIAVFGMRLILPILIVAAFGTLWPWDAAWLAFTDGHHYGEILHSAHWEIAAFGGMFLAMVFIDFIIAKREIKWIAPLERSLEKLGQLKSFSNLIGLMLVVAVPFLAPAGHRFSTILSAAAGLAIYMAVDMLKDRMEADEDKQIVKGVVKSGAASFLYLEVLDASFSFDGVIGAFAMSTNVIIISAGLGIGAFFVRSMTVFLVRGGHLDELPHLEHAAHYAIGVLAMIMFIGMSFHVPEIFTGLMGAAFVLVGVMTSIAYNRRHPQAVNREKTTAVETPDLTGAPSK